MIKYGTIDREVFKRKHGDIQAQIQLVDSRLQDIQEQNKIDIDLIEEVLAFTRNIGQTYKEAPIFYNAITYASFMRRF